MADRSYNDIIEEAIALARLAHPSKTISTDPVPKNNWGVYLKKPEYADIEFVSHKKIPGQEAASTGNPDSGKLGWGYMRKRPTFED